MQHCTPEQLALAALREPLPAEDAAHLASCARLHAPRSPRCGASVDAVAVPQLAAPGAPVPPPPHVWEAIAAATGVPPPPPRPPAPPNRGPPVAEPPAGADVLRSAPAAARCCSSPRPW